MKTAVLCIFSEIFLGCVLSISFRQRCDKRSRLASRFFRAKNAIFWENPKWLGNKSEILVAESNKK